MPIADSPDFQPLTDLLAESLLASYLLGLSQTQSGIGNRQSAISFQDPIETAFNLPPKEAIEYFQAKKIMRKREFNKLAKEARSAAFTVGKVYNDNVLRGFRDELKLSLDEGRTQSATIKRFHDILAGASHKQLSPFHLETVFRVNMGTAYAVGRRQGLESVAEDLPVWQYHTVGDDRVRPKHAALNGLMLPADNPFWQDHYPPWDWLCRCAVTAAAEIPQGYDQQNPSGIKDEFGEPLVQLSYDDRGMPAKVENGTTLYDLQVGNFSGIPPFATLKTAIEAGVERAAAERRIEELRVNSHTFADEDEVNTWAERHYRGWLDSLSPDELSALQQYKGSGHYHLNRYLRHVKQQVIDREFGEIFYKRWGRHLDRAIDKAVLPEDVVVYRGLSSKGARRVREGDEFLDRGYVSSSLLKETAEAFLVDESSVLAEILLHRGQHALVKAAFMEFPSIRQGITHESELLLPRGTRFRVLQRRREKQPGTKQKFVILTLEVIK